MIVADAAHFSGVISHSGPDYSYLDCASVGDPAAIYVFNSSYFAVDGVTVKNCGGATGAISIHGSSDILVGNSTSVTNSKIYNSTGHGIYLSSTTRAVVYKNSVMSAAKSGIYATSKSYGPIISGNIIASNLIDGVYIGEGTTIATIRGNIISSNGNTGVMLSNIGKLRNVTKHVIVNNIITENAANSILISVDSASYVLSTIICGNTMKGNGLGVGVVDPAQRCVQSTIYANNNDFDGVNDSFLALTNGMGSTGWGNYMLDPLDRGRYFISGDTVTSSPPSSQPSSLTPSSTKPSSSRTSAPSSCTPSSAKPSTNTPSSSNPSKSTESFSPSSNQPAQQTSTYPTRIADTFSPTTSPIIVVVGIQSIFVKEVSCGMFCFLNNCKKFKQKIPLLLENFECVA
jgi:hypothetical protein